MAVELTISSSQGQIAERHDLRLFTPENADKALEKYNEHFIDTGGKYGKTNRELFNEFYAPDVAAFNAKQTRNDRKIGPESTKESRQKTYFDGIEDGTFCYGKGKTKEEAIYEAVLQIGNKDDCGVTDDKFDNKYWMDLKKKDEKAASDYAVKHFNNNARMKDVKAALKKAVRAIQNFDPEHLHVLRAEYHCDEPNGTPHVHIVYTLRATDYQKGMKNRVGSVKALAQMGFEKTVDSEYGITQLHEKFKDIIEEEMIIQNPTLRRKAYSGEHRERSTVSEYKALMEQREINKRYWDEANAKEEQARILQQTAEATLKEIEEKQKELDDAWAEFEEEKAGEMADVYLMKQELEKKMSEVNLLIAELNEIKEITESTAESSEQNVGEYKTRQQWMMSHKRNGKTFEEIYLQEKAAWESKPHLGAGMSKADLQKKQAELIAKAESFEMDDFIGCLQK